MVSPFKFADTPRIIFGSGKLKLLTKLIENYARLPARQGNSVLLITGENSFVQTENWDFLLLQFERAKIKWKHFIIGKEPTPDLIDDCVTKKKPLGWIPMVPENLNYNYDVYVRETMPQIPDNDRLSASKALGFV